MIWGRSINKIEVELGSIIKSIAITLIQVSIWPSNTCNPTKKYYNTFGHTKCNNTIKKTPNKLITILPSNLNSLSFGVNKTMHCINC